MCLGYVMSLIPHHSAENPTIPNEPNEPATKKRRIQQERASVSAQVEALTTSGMLVLESIGIDVGLSIRHLCARAHHGAQEQEHSTF